jgi:hypothetical protein
VRVAVVDSQTASPKIATRGTRKGFEGGKKGQECCPRRLTARVSNGSAGEEIEDSDEEFVVMAERDFKRHTRPHKGHIEKVLEAACPHHPYYVKHKLRDCTMMKRLMSSADALPGGDELKKTQ